MANNRIFCSPICFAASTGKLSWSSPSVIKITSRNSVWRSSKTSSIVLRSASPIKVPPRVTLWGEMFVERQAEKTVIECQRTLDHRRPRESHQSNPISLQTLDRIDNRQLGPLEPIRRKILGQHALRDIEQESHIAPPPLDFPAPSGSRPAWPAPSPQRQTPPTATPPSNAAAAPPPRAECGQAAPDPRTLRAPAAAVSPRTETPRPTAESPTTGRASQPTAVAFRSWNPSKHRPGQNDLQAQQPQTGQREGRENFPVVHKPRGLDLAFFKPINFLVNLAKRFGLLGDPV